MRITSKADALVFAIEKSTTDEGMVNCEQADKIYRMFADNIHLPEHHTEKIDECMSKLNSLIGKLKAEIESSMDKDAAPAVDAEEMK